MEGFKVLSRLLEKGEGGINKGTSLELYNLYYNLGKIIFSEASLLAIFQNGTKSLRIN